METVDCSADRDIVEQVVGHMVQKSVDSGIVRRDEMVLILEDMIQSLERGTLAIALENA